MGSASHRADDATIVCGPPQALTTPVDDGIVVSLLEDVDPTLADGPVSTSVQPNDDRDEFAEVGIQRGLREFSRTGLHPRPSVTQRHARMSHTRKKRRPGRILSPGSIVVLLRGHARPAAEWRKDTMKRIMVRYRVKRDRLDEHVGYITQVFEQLAREQPTGLRYASFRLDDQVSFVHLASIETADGKNPLSSLSAFKAFTEQIKDRCDESPVAVDLHEVGAYRFLTT
jgi:hypothetical protein